MDEIEGLDAQVERLEASLGGAVQVAAAFEAELRGMQETMLYTGREVGTLSRSVGRGFRRAFDGLIFDGMALSDALRTVATSVVDSAYNIAMRPVQNAVGGAVANGLNSLISGVMPFAAGGVMTQGRVTPFASGGVVRGPVAFPMRGGAGLMGEAGPEAIMPLTRGPDGRLGVAASGGARPVNVTVNIQTPDLSSFQRSRSQIAAQMGRAIGRGERNR